MEIYHWKIDRESNLINRYFFQKPGLKKQFEIFKKINFFSNRFFKNNRENVF